MYFSGLFLGNPQHMAHWDGIMLQYQRDTIIETRMKARCIMSDVLEGGLGLEHLCCPSSHGGHTWTNESRKEGQINHQLTAWQYKYHDAVRPLTGKVGHRISFSKVH